MAFHAISKRHRPHPFSLADLAMENERLHEENAQLRQAVTSHATIDQALGAVVALGHIGPEEAWRVLRDVSQHTNTKLRVVAEHILSFAQGDALPNPELDQLRQALSRYEIHSRAGRPS